MRVFQHLANILNLTNYKVFSVLITDCEFFMITSVIFWCLADILTLMNHEVFLMLSVNCETEIEDESENDEFISNTDCLHFHEKISSVTVISVFDCFNFNSFCCNCFLILLFFIFSFCKYILIFSLKIQSWEIIINCW